MLKLIKICFFLIFLLEHLNAQIYLKKTNLAAVCRCDPSNSSKIFINKKIKAIDPDTFTNLTSLQTLWIPYNKILSIHPATFTGLTSIY